MHINRYLFSQVWGRLRSPHHCTAVRIRRGKCSSLKPLGFLCNNGLHSSSHPCSRDGKSSRPEKQISVTYFPDHANLMSENMDICSVFKKCLFKKNCVSIISFYSCPHFCNPWWFWLTIRETVVRFVYTKKHMLNNDLFQRWE